MKERKLVEQMLGESLCANPYWDMLLDLYLAEMEGRSVYQSAMCLATRVPRASAHRLTAKLEGLGVIVRRNDPGDGRRVNVSLAPITATALDRIMDMVVQILDHRT